ncbi:unnamed protein product [Mytilus coruscus]|uniref:Uncharacterized protein n=1 Tax=Mytilus coruscus TaxID=42192 RepID=A0A6J8AXV8_MYTCO|nr:unnamed protein product [Mytilus coruscus]
MINFLSNDHNIFIGKENLPVTSVAEALASPSKRRLYLSERFEETSKVYENENSKRRILKISGNGATLAVKLWGTKTDLQMPERKNNVIVHGLQMREPNDIFNVDFQRAVIRHNCEHKCECDLCKEPLEDTESSAPKVKKKARLMTHKKKILKTLLQQYLNAHNEVTRFRIINPKT